MNTDALVPRPGVSLRGQGVVSEHRRVLGHYGRWFGLYLLTVDGSGLEFVGAWTAMLPKGAVVSLAQMDTLRRQRLHIYYKIKE